MSEIEIQDIGKVPKIAEINPFEAALTGIKKEQSKAEREKRIERCKDFGEFCKTYLPHHFSLDWGEHHLDLHECIQSPKKKKRIVRAEPRDHGKSTTMLIGAPLYMAAHKLKYFIILFGSTSDAIQPHFSAMQDELDPDSGNKLLLDDFPHLKPKMDFKGQFISWTDTGIRLESGCTIECRGYFSKFRGIKQKHHRPDCLILDDPQDEEDIATKFRRDKFMRRFKRTVLNIGGPDCDIYLEGNYMHHAGLIATYLKNTAWDRKLYKAYNVPPKEGDPYVIGNTKTDGSPLWPARWPKEVLEAKKEDLGPTDFALEFMNEERDMSQVIYDSTEFHRFDPNSENFDVNRLNVLAWWDPSTGKDKESSELDFSCIAVVGFKVTSTNTKLYWVLDVFLERAPANQQIDAAINLLRKWPIKRLLYAGTGGFEVMAPFIKEKAKKSGVAMPLYVMTEKTNKIQCIMNAEPVVKNRMFFSTNLPVNFFDQWDEFPTGSHDDGPDAVARLLELLEKYRKIDPVWGRKA